MRSLKKKYTAYKQKYGLTEEGVALFAKVHDTIECTRNYLCQLGVEPDLFPSYFAFTAQLLKEPLLDRLERSVLGDRYRRK